MINKVSLQETVEAVIGGSVLLPCSSTQHDLKPQDTDVHWRHNGSKIVYDIVKGKDSLELQDPRYKNRAETFPQECERGNYSIKLTDLTHNDAGKYICQITPSDEQETVQLIINVCLQETTVKAVIGGSVLLPCSSTEHDLKPQDINVFWRHNGHEIVYDIIPNSNSLEKQNPEYKNRTETFPEEYERGNFSIKLNKIIYADAGTYICYITHSSEQPIVQLIINESTAEKGTVSTEKENQGDSVETSLLWLSVGIASVIIVIVIGFIVAWWIRKNSSCRRTDRHDMSDAHELEHMNQ
ncbi:CD276 antigen homolog isoform X2 [Siphateles boraxobius]|uniref:CD276 antigen homolog isoform X2 n=1 Tax=Siphateles boraxobius TaxID=180520 RepID=UPI00406414BB